LLAGKTIDASLKNVAVSGRIDYGYGLFKIGGIAGSIINSDIDGVTVNDTNFIFTESVPQIGALSVIGAIAGELNASKVSGYSVVNSGAPYGSNKNGSMLLTDETSVTVHVYEGNSIKSDGNKNRGHKHTQEYSIGLDFDKLVAQGYKTVKITMSVQIRAEDKGSGRRIWLDLDKRNVFKRENLYVGNTNWHYISYVFTVPISEINVFTKFRIGFETERYPFSEAIWWFNSADVTFEVVR
jgi:hypothetical protein